MNALLDHQDYPTGQKVKDAEMRALNITKSAWHGEWNYTIAPEGN